MVLPQFSPAPSAALLTAAEAAARTGDSIVLRCNQAALQGVRDSKAQAEQVGSVAVERVGQLIGQVPANIILDINEALRLHLAEFPTDLAERGRIDLLTARSAGVCQGPALTAKMTANVEPDCGLDRHLRIGDLRG